MKLVENIMCKETEKLIRLLGESKNPTDMALVVLANKLDILDEKIDKLNKSTEFARWIDNNKKFLVSLFSGLIVLALFGLRVFVEFLKRKLGL